MPEDKNTPLDKMTPTALAETIISITDSISSFISSKHPESQRLKEFIEGGYSPQEMSDSINELLQKLQSVPDEGRTLLDVNKGATDAEKARIKEIANTSADIIPIAGFIHKIGSSDRGKGMFSEDGLKFIENLEKTSWELSDLSRDLVIGKVDFKAFREDYPSLTYGDETKQQMYDIKSSAQKNTDIAEGPQKGTYFKRLGPDGEEEGKWATTYYKDKDDNLVLFSSLDELNNHISENHPNIKPIEGSEDYDFTAFPDSSFNTSDLSNLDNIYDDAKSAQYKEGGPKIGEYFKRYGPEGEEEGKWATTYYKGDDGEYTLFASKDELDKHILDRGNKQVQIKPYTSPYFDEDETTLLDSLYDQEKERQRTTYTADGNVVTPPPSDASKDEEVNNEIGNVVTGLKAAAGLVSLGKAMEDIPLDDETELSESFKSYMRQSKELAESGLTAKEKASIRNDLSNSYNLGAKNVLRASAGSRGTFLANMGMLNANRVSALIKMGQIDSEMQRKNMDAYGKLLTFQEKYNQQEGLIGREMAYKEATRKSSLHGGIGASLIGSAIDDIAANEQTKKMGPYLEEMAKQMGLSKTYMEQTQDARDDMAVMLQGVFSNDNDDDTTE